jgi:VCBS repeat protein/thrombospondin type 3 repeat protein/FG-GAP repeat protein
MLDSRRRIRRWLSTSVLTALMALAVAAPAGASPTPPWDPFFASQQTAADFGATNRPFGVAAGDFDKDGKLDLVVGRTTGNVAYVKGAGDGSFAAPSVFAWKQAFFNAWSFAAGDVNGDGNLDVIWGASAASSGCSISPIPAGQTCATAGGATVSVADGDVRVWYGNGNGSFQENPYFVSGVRHNGGALLANVGIDAGSLAAKDVDGDGDVDIVVGQADAAHSTVKLLRNNGAGAVTVETLIDQPPGTSPGDPIYFPAISTQNSPWGLALGDANNDGDQDLWIGDRALYVYLYENDGSGHFTLHGGNSAVSSRPNVYVGHDSYRASVGFTPSLSAADVNGDGRADLALGLQSGTQTPASGIAHDGELLLDLSSGGTHTGFGSVADIGTEARGVTLADFNGDGYNDMLAAEYDGKVKLLRQLAPLDTDGDGVSDYVDNAPNDANAPRLDLNTDGSVNYRDQLDNDGDTVLGDPENPATWQRLGDAADPDDDNDGVPDASDNCKFVANAGQADSDSDGRGDACDPLDDRDTDADNVPDGPSPGDPGYAAARDAAIKWSRGDTHFVIRIDALGRFFQNEFTQILTDAGTLTPAQWEAKCWEDYGDGDPADPCGTGEGTGSQTLTLGGGKEVPITLVTIPKQLWTDPPVIDWINDRNDNATLEIGQHGTYHVDNTPISDWASLPDRNFFSCELCGLSKAEEFELLRAGRDTLLGNYSTKSVAESGATGASPKIDWSSSAHQLISFAPPFNTSDPDARYAIAALGYKAFSASVFEEGETGSWGPIFSPEGSHHERFDQFGVFHASADLELDPPDTTGDNYDHAAWDNYLQSKTDDGGLTTWLIEEVEWSGRPCPNADRLGTCNGGSNREDDTVYLPRWEAWLQLLDFVKNYPGGVAMTMGEVALAKGYDNAPTASNPGQADSDHDGIGDVIDGAALTAQHGSLTRGQASSLSATLKNGAGDAIPGQKVRFSFDADNDGTDEHYDGVTGSDGKASVSVTPTRPSEANVPFDVSWDGGRGVTASDSASADIADATHVTLDSGNPSSGQFGDQVTVGATLKDSAGDPLSGRTLSFNIGTAGGSGTTDSNGHASATLTLAGPVGSQTLKAAFAGAGLLGASDATAVFAVQREDTVLVVPNAVAAKRGGPSTTIPTLTEADGAALAGRTLKLLVLYKGSYQQVDSQVTTAQGKATLTVPNKYVTNSAVPIRVVFDGDATYLGVQKDAQATR